ncbi:MAG: hypothetical protein C0621_07165 [Desulfuromonas sp.]|nr:MAG: hypothetical protein C0621_07165 [Desulfuromonas sp.]
MTQPRFLLVPQLDLDEKWVALAQTFPGKFLLVAGFSGLLFLHEISYWWLLSIYLLAFSAWPEKRWGVLFAATWSFLLVGPTDFHWERISHLFISAGIPWEIHNSLAGLPLILLTLLIAGGYIHLSQRCPQRLRRPILVLTLFFLGMMLIASYAPLPRTITAGMWVFLTLLGQYYWFVCFTLKECRSPQALSFSRQVGQYLPFWEPTVIPYPKGSGYLRKIEAKTARDFAICQLKGLKLLIWAFWLKLFYFTASLIFFGQAGLLFDRLLLKNESGKIALYWGGRFLREISALPHLTQLPRFESAMNMAATGNPLPWQMNWAVLLSDFLCFLLYVAFTTHIVIAVIRMCGFNALRNTYRPLESKTIAEFWNRYFYYFKELLVEFFFYPTFFRYFKKRPVLRMYVATMAAAFFGNFLFHFIRDIWFVVELGFFRALFAFHTYFIYSFVLGNMIFLSQWRQEKVSQMKMGVISRWLAPVRVLGFYCLLTIFVDFRRESISENLAFFLSLFPFS